MKKFATMAISTVLIGTMALGGSLAYLQDTDSDVNVMTLGSVKIEQHEYQRVGTDGSYETKEIDGVISYVLEKFEQNKPLLPIVGDPNEPGNSPAYKGWDNTTVRMTQVDSYGSMNVFAGKNAQDKFVTVENTGKTDAYVRTLVAIEVGTAGADLIGTSYHNTWKSNDIGTIAIDGVNYYVTEYVYAGGLLSDNTWRHENGVLPAGDTSYPNLSQVYIKSAATNEDMVAIDGNNNGTLDILVLSQAVQTAGFEAEEDASGNVTKSAAAVALDTAFGKASEKAAEWFGGVTIPTGTYVASEEELNAAVAAGGDIVLAKDITLTNTVTVPAGVTVNLDLNGYTINQEKECTGSYSMIENNGNLTITGDGKLSFKDTGVGDPTFGWGSYTISNRGNLKVENGTIEHLGVQDFATHCIMAIYQYSGSTTINGGTISTPNYRSARLWYGDMTINGGTFDGQVWVQAVDGAAQLTINGGNFSPNGGDGSSVFVGNGTDNVTLSITGGTFNTKIGCSTPTGNGVAGKITGGTFAAGAYDDTDQALFADSMKNQ